jgi:hypothetical protein
MSIERPAADSYIHMERLKTNIKKPKETGDTYSRLLCPIQLNHGIGSTDRGTCSASATGQKVYIPSLRGLSTAESQGDISTPSLTMQKYLILTQY